MCKALVLVKKKAEWAGYRPGLVIFCDGLHSWHEKHYETG